MRLKATHLGSFFQMPRVLGYRPVQLGFVIIIIVFFYILIKYIFMKNKFNLF
jgi:uncharacterized membrane protein YdbT with pleckstrin-like domain